MAVGNAGFMNPFPLTLLKNCNEKDMDEKDMTTIHITIQERNGKPTITWMDKKGDPLPEGKWDEFVLATAKVFDNKK